MTTDCILLSESQEGIATITLNRPERHNAFDDVLIGRMLEAIAVLETQKSLRALVIASTGKSFSAGADLDWMQRMASYGERENLADARLLAELMRALRFFSRPTIALVQGAAYGGGVGLVACCDTAICTASAQFCLSEVRLGLIPSVISPYVIEAIGARAARRYFITAERFDAQVASQLGLVHEVVSDEEQLAVARKAIVKSVLAGGPQAQVAAKKLINDVAGEAIEQALIEETARRIAERRASDEGREGPAAFLGKRKPNWI